MAYISNELVVTSSYGYLERTLPNATDDVISKFHNENLKQVELLDQIIATEVAYYIMRRVTSPSIDQLTSDTLGHLNSKLIKEYEKKFEKYIDYNKDVDY